MSELRLEWREVEDATWEELVQTAPLKHPFASLDWGRLSERCFGGSFSPYAGYRGKEAQFLVPLYKGKPWAEESSFSIGAVGYGGPIPCREELFQALPEEMPGLIKSLSKSLDARLAALTSFPHAVWSQYSKECSFTQIAPVPEDVSELFETQIHKSLRTAIRKAQRLGLVVEQLDKARLEKAVELLHATQAGVGASYRSPLSLIEELMEKKRFADLLIVQHDGALIAFSAFLYSSEDSFHLFNGWSSEHSKLCANQLVLFEAFKRSADRNISRLNLGESHYPSLKEAKAKWGAKEVPFIRQRFEAEQTSFLE